MAVLAASTPRTIRRGRRWLRCGGPSGRQFAVPSGRRGFAPQCTCDALKNQGQNVATHEGECGSCQGRHSASLRRNDRSAPLADRDYRLLLCRRDRHRCPDRSGGTCRCADLAFGTQSRINLGGPRHKRDRPLRADLDTLSAPIAPIHLDEQHMRLPPPASLLSRALEAPTKPVKANEGSNLNSAFYFLPSLSMRSST